MEHGPPCELVHLGTWHAKHGAPPRSVCNLHMACAAVRPSKVGQPSAAPAHLRAASGSHVPGDPDWSPGCRTVPISSAAASGPLRAHGRACVLAAPVRGRPPAPDNRKDRLACCGAHSPAAMPAHCVPHWDCPRMRAQMRASLQRAGKEAPARQAPGPAGSELAITGVPAS